MQTVIIITCAEFFFRERLVVPAEKPFITLSGMNTKSTIITGDKPRLTVTNPTVSILASDVVVRYLTIQVIRISYVHRSNNLIYNILLMPFFCLSIGNSVN